MPQSFDDHLKFFLGKICSCNILVNMTTNILSGYNIIGNKIL